MFVLKIVLYYKYLYDKMAVLSILNYTMNYVILYFVS